MSIDVWQYFHAHLQDNVVAGFIYSGIIAVFAWFVFIKKILICEQKWCFRIGHHKVENTHYKTCPKHTTDKHHKSLQAKHARKHPKTQLYLRQENK